MASSRPASTCASKPKRTARFRRRNRIPGLDKAPRNSAGLVEYRTPVTLILPESPRKGNGTLLVDVPNRGRAISHGLYNNRA